MVPHFVADGKVADGFVFAPKLHSERAAVYPRVMVPKSIRCFLIRVAAALCAIASASTEPLVRQPGELITIAVPDFHVADSADRDIAHTIARVVAADLESSGVFAPIDALHKSSGSI